jgi:hypothetical protein
MMNNIEKDGQVAEQEYDLNGVIIAICDHYQSKIDSLQAAMQPNGNIDAALQSSNVKKTHKDLINGLKVNFGRVRRLLEYPKEYLPDVKEIEVYTSNSTNICRPPEIK